MYLAPDHALNSLFTRINRHPLDEGLVIYCDNPKNKHGLRQGS